MKDPAIRLSGLRKAFGRNQVLRGIDLSIPEGQVTVLMGANGAGKSTLVKVLCGVHAADEGQVTLDGKPFAPGSPSEALRAGVVTVHQNINDGVVPDLDVASNLLLDALADGAGTFLNRRKMRARAREIAAAVGLEIEVTRQVADLSLADRQLVAIARAMAHDPRLMILDEPTSSLSAVEAERLFDLIESLRDRGVAILYISHRMSDIRRLADRIVSMRDGQISGLFEDQPLDYSGSVRAMLGHEMTEADITIPAPGRTVLEVTDLVLRPGAEPFSMIARENEVIAITGLVGSGKSDFAGALFGLEPPLAGSMQLDGRPHRPASSRAAIGAGVYMCPKDRLVTAVVADFDITRNITIPFLPRHSRASFLSRRSEKRTAERMIGEMGVVCQSPLDGILTLSGGNQQKVMVARWMAEASRLLILDEPFQGVDIQARRDIGHKIRATADTRATIVFVAELDEALEIADRILVMSEHSIVGEHRNENIDVSAIMAEVVEAVPTRAAGKQDA
ncbi:sugar ABC transporter ATP-binding protein [Thioclava sp. L04-15]|uniref:sugar ABC transporter ATP-binding protein n=1 Tax=Thioclava sp. L04-15 TaxID=1915318 RepID=UPI000997D6F6|nr:sugar ABC transporter ATP-binding protein [Thioclava sp. L04-15]OOY27854.1 sugar ABC transporter ATP-binding protein [Thioclava sp. L04-15]TNE93224.1 MAG: sugar ABC transporter ATP-binding protein [Paracoccaceae bacterium]